MKEIQYLLKRGAKLIPKIVGVVLDKRTSNSQVTNYITHCPECNTELNRKEGDAKHFCLNTSECPPQIIGRIQHYISRKAMDIDGLGAETVSLLVENGLIKNYSDLYDLKISQLLPLERMAEKSAENLIAGVMTSKQVPFERLLFALGIRYVGETVAKKLAKHYKNIDDLSNATEEKLIHVDEIGDVIAKSVIDFFADDKNRNIVSRLKLAGVQLEISKEKLANQTDKLMENIFVVSGVFTMVSRNELKQLIEDNGGKISSAISKKNQFCCCRG